MVKKFIALFVSSIFAFSLGIAYAEEENIRNPWERDMQTSAKKVDKAEKQDKKTNKNTARKADVKKAKKKNPEKIANASMEKTGKKETAQKKKFLFW